MGEEGLGMRLAKLETEGGGLISGVCSVSLHVRTIFTRLEAGASIY